MVPPPTNLQNRSSLSKTDSFSDELNHHPDLDVAWDCPKTLRTILDLIDQTYLSFEDLKQSSENNTPQASSIYDRQLLWRAQEMSQAYSKRGLNNVSESQWRIDMSRHAFLSLDSSEEEKTNNDRQYHHW